MELTPASAIPSCATGSNRTDRPIRARSQREVTCPALAWYTNSPQADAMTAPTTANTADAKRIGTAAAIWPIRRGTSCR